TGVFLDAVPAFPPLAALPEPGPAPAVSLLALAAPFVAGAVGGVLTIRSRPAPVSEGAPMWGFVTGALTGAVVALLSALSGGPLGGGRMATVGPSAWRVGLLAALEVGIAAAIAAWAANTMILRRPARAEAEAGAGAGRRAKAKKRPAKRPRTRETPVPAPLSAPVPEDHGTPAAPAPKPPFPPDRLEFEEADPLRRPRRPRRRPDPLPDIEPDIEPAIEEEPPAREPAPQSGGTVVVEGHLVD